MDANLALKKCTWNVSCPGERQCRFLFEPLEYGLFSVSYSASLSLPQKLNFSINVKIAQMNLSSYLACHISESKDFESRIAF